MVTYLDGVLSFVALVEERFLIFCNWTFQPLNVSAFVVPEKDSVFESDDVSLVELPLIMLLDLSRFSIQKLHLVEVVENDARLQLVLLVSTLDLCKG
jgi:hypothetical protein